MSGPARLAKATLTASSVNLYTSPSGGAGTAVKEILLCNTSGAAATVTVSLDGMVILSAMPVASLETKFISLSSLLPPGAVLSALASVAAAVNLYASGVEL